MLHEYYKQQTYTVRNKLLALNHEYKTLYFSWEGGKDAQWIKTYAA